MPEGTMSRDELERRLADLRRGALPPSETYHTIHQFGRAHFLEARPDVERFLTDDDPELRYIALEVLTTHWRLPEHWETARHFLEQDPFDGNRILGASALESLKQDTRDRPTLAVLARVVRNEQERRMVREAAYIAMQGIIHYDPRAQFNLSATGVNLAHDVDWALVDSYLPVSE